MEQSPEQSAPNEFDPHPETVNYTSNFLIFYFILRSKTKIKKKIVLTMYEQKTVSHLDTYQVK